MPAIPHLRLARLLADRVAPKYNRYGSPAVIRWPVGKAPARLTARCSSFLSAVLGKAYTIDLKAWLESTSPNSARYHKAIVDGDRFARLVHVGELQPGDVLAIEHRTSSASGHTAMLDGLPRPRAATRPIVPGTTQYELPVLDVTSTPHGPTDSRVVSSGDEGEGVGRGIMRLYVDSAGVVVGHTWSLRSTAYRAQAERPIAFGRYLAQE